MLFLDRLCQAIIEVFSRIAEGCKDDNLLVAFVYLIRKLMAKVSDELLQHAIVLGGNVRQHQQKQVQVFQVF